MSGLETLADARIRAWLAQPEAERRASHPSLEPGRPLEVQFWEDVQRLDALAAACPDPVEATALERAASDLMLRLMVLLEGQGRPLAARHFAEQRSAGPPRT